MSRSVAAKHLRQVVSLWPHDPLRPEVQFQSVLAARLARLEDSSRTVPEAEIQASLRQTNAAYALLANRFSSRARIEGDLLRPKSSPAYYEELERDLTTAPNRGFMPKLMNTLKGMFRIS